MDVKQLISKLKQFNLDAVVTVGESGAGWSNIHDVVPDGSSLKIIIDSDLPLSDE